MSKSTKDYVKYFQKPDMRASKKRSREEVKVVYADLEYDQKIKEVASHSYFYIRTYGCQMNVHDTEVICGILTELGYTQTEDMEQANLLIFNTCAIRENAENKVFGEIGRLSYLKKQNPDTIFAVCGCMSQEESVVEKILTKYQFIDVVFGTHNIHRLPEILKHAIFDKQKVIEVWSQEGEIIEELPKVREHTYKAWVNIIYGCDKFCTYCIVPYTRGKERSRLKEDVLAEIQDLKDKGYQEVTLLGQNVNAYGKDLDDGSYKMGDLLRDVAKIGIPRIRFMTSHPWDFDDDMIEAIKEYDNIIPHIHLPVQSGNDAILKIMGRNYTREQYLTLFNKLKSIPNVSITTDIIVGYPNETYEQFEDTLSLYEYCQFDSAFTFIYSPREGTPASKMQDDVSIEEKQKRLTELNKLVDKYMVKTNEDQIGKTLQVLIEGVSKKDNTYVSGYSQNNKLVIVKGDESMVGKIYDVKITGARRTSLDGEVVGLHEY